MNLAPYNQSEKKGIKQLIETVFLESEGQEEGHLIAGLVDDMMNHTDNQDILGIFNAKVGSKSQANQRMDEDVYPTVINSVNKLEFNEFFDQEILENLLDERQETLNERMVNQFGIYVSDIGINRKTFPANNISTIEEKMTKEIEKESAQSIAEGDSIYNQKVAQVDAEKAQVLADAVEAAAIIKAEADAEAIRTYQEALDVDLSFYQFIQRMDIYTEIKDSTIFLDRNNAIFEYLNDIENVGTGSTLNN